MNHKITEHLNQPEISPNIRLEDMLRLAANCQLHAHDLYVALARLYPMGEAENSLEALASWELEHKQRTEFLYAEVAFTETNGG